MNEKLKINIVSGLIITYGLFVLINSLVYYFIILPGETDIVRGIIRAFGSFVLAYGIYKRNKFIYWVTLIFSGIIILFGFFGIFAMMKIEMEWTNYSLLIPIIIFMFVFFILIQKKVKAEFK